MQLEIINFINNNTDWEQKLSNAPYFIKVKREGEFILLRYSQLESDFSIPLVRECRGLILNETNGYIPVCVPFFKFGNYGESYVPDINWKTARVEEKIDGSIVKLWNYNGRWHVSSNNEIDAKNASIHSMLLTGKKETNIYSLFMEAFKKTGRQMDSLDTNYTYIFELTSPYNRVVVKYDELSIRHIGTRNNKTLLEYNIDIGIAKPQTFNIKSLAECIKSAEELDENNEGYVVVDNNYNRLKVKSPKYITLAHMASGITTYKNALEIIMENEQEEVLTYFPEYRELFDKIEARIEEFYKRLTEVFQKIEKIPFDTRKELAEVVLKTECPACVFALYDKKASDARSWLLQQPSSKIIKYIGLAESAELDEERYPFFLKKGEQENVN